MSDLTCFKAYDIRGRLGIDLDENIAYRIGAAFAVALMQKTVVLGRDVRASSEAAKSVAQGLNDQGCDVLDLGLSGTEEMYFATTHFGADGGICVTASHNPMDYNGMKMVRAGSAPLDAGKLVGAHQRAGRRKCVQEKRHSRANPDSRRRSARGVRGRDLPVCRHLRSKAAENTCECRPWHCWPDFRCHRGTACRAWGPLAFERLFHEPDGTFPQGIPNPLLPENRPRLQKPFALQALISGVRGTVILIAASSLITLEPSSTANMSSVCSRRRSSPKTPAQQ